ncbi:MAG: hypothetical protein E6614_37535 [Bradyrhizobium sp.]|nr:hypothetical protein [Bradyrhizobium sp.]
MAATEMLVVDPVQIDLVGGNAKIEAAAGDQLMRASEGYCASSAAGRGAMLVQVAVVW